MSDNIRIQFDSDMPPASVEVVSPSLETVQRLWMDTGQLSGVISVPSEESFLRVNLASGESLVLQQPGASVRSVSLSDFSKSVAEKRALGGEVFGSVNLPHLGELPAVQLEYNIEVRLLCGETPLKGFGSGPSASFRDFSFLDDEREALDLIARGSGWEFRVRLPKQLRHVGVEVSAGEASSPTLSIKVATDNPQADALSSFMSRGDYYSAQGMVSWVDKAESMLRGKVNDPWAAAVGAYLLLRLRRFDLMRDWPKNLADWWPNLADGSVIWAWQQIHQKGDEEAIRLYLNGAADAELPVFSQGLKLLNEGLKLIEMSNPESPRIKSLYLGVVQWDSPFTAIVQIYESNIKPPQFNVEYGSFPPDF